MRQAVNELGRRAIDKRTRTGKALAAWRKELIADMGGDDNVSTQQKTIIDLIVKQKLLLDTVDAWLLTRPLIDRPSKSLIPVVRERQTLADALARYLGQLGLERHNKIKTLKQLLEDEGDDVPSRY